MINDEKQNSFISIWRCGPKFFSCADPEKTIHFKFDRFETERNYDYLEIGHEKKIGLLLDGKQQTHIWVNAESIPDFNVYFYREASTNHDLSFTIMYRFIPR